MCVAYIEHYYLCNVFLCCFTAIVYHMWLEIIIRLMTGAVGGAGGAGGDCGGVVGGNCVGNFMLVPVCGLQPFVYYRYDCI